LERRALARVPAVRERRCRRALRAQRINTRARGFCPCTESTRPPQRAALLFIPQHLAHKLGKRESDQSGTKQHKTHNHQSDGKLRSELLTHGAPPNRAPRALLEANNCPDAQSKGFPSDSPISAQVDVSVQHLFRKSEVLWAPLRPRLCSCFRWRLIFARWPRRKTPLSRAEKPPIGFICELEKQIRVGPVLRGEGQFAISDRAKTAHGFSQHNMTRFECMRKCGSRPAAGVASGPDRRSLSGRCFGPAFTPLEPASNPPL
jgi:hypothetical protein